MFKNLEIVMKTLYTEEEIKNHVENYNSMKKTLKECKLVSSYSKSNIKCFNFYKFICFVYYKLNSKLAAYLLLISYKNLVNRTIALGEKLGEK